MVENLLPDAEEWFERTPGKPKVSQLVARITGITVVSVIATSAGVFGSTQINVDVATIATLKPTLQEWAFRGLSERRTDVTSPRTLSPQLLYHLTHRPASGGCQAFGHWKRQFLRCCMPPRFLRVPSGLPGP